MTGFLCFGELLLRLSAPHQQRLFQSASLDTHFGGAEANVANLLAALGNDSALFSILPDNALGHACQRFVQEFRTDTRHILFTPGRLAAYYLERGTMMRPSAITYDRQDSAFVRYDHSQTDWAAMLKDKHWLHLCGITMALNANCSNAVIAAAHAAKKAGVKISFDCNFRASLWAGREAEMTVLKKEIVSLADLLFAGSRDARYLTDTEYNGIDPKTAFAEASQSYLAAFPNLSHVASTYRDVLSSDHNILTGFYRNRKGLFESRPQKLEAIVDRIGGGDAFAGGVLHQLGQGADHQDIIDFATTSAAIKHSILGDTNRTSEAEIRALMSGQSGDVQR